MSGVRDGSESYLVESAALTIRIGRIACLVAFPIVGFFFWFDTVVGLQGIWPWRVPTLVLAAVFLAGTFTFQKSRPVLTIGLYALWLLSVMLQATGVAWAVFGERQEIIALAQAGAMGGIYDAAIVVFAAAAGARPLLPAILLLPVGGLALGLYFRGGVTTPEWTLFADPVVVASVLSLASLVQEGMRRKEFGARAELARARAEAETRSAELAFANARLSVVNADLVQFANVVAHDLRQPLQSVSALTHLMASRLATLGVEDPKVHEYLTIAAESVGRMDRLVANLLEYTRLDRRTLRLVEVDLNKTLAAVQVDLAHAISKANATVRVGPLPTITADPQEMAQLFQNLVSNAIRYARPGVPPVIEVIGKAEAKMAIVEVRDNGIGIAQENLAVIFEPFRRLADNGNGLGLGLAICKRIVERHRGTISVTSEPGVGTVFCVTLPIVQAVESAP